MKKKPKKKPKKKIEINETAMMILNIMLDAYVRAAENAGVPPEILIPATVAGLADYTGQEEEKFLYLLAVGSSSSLAFRERES